MKVLHISQKIDGGGAESVFRDTIHSLNTYDKANTHLVACSKHDSETKVDLDFSATDIGYSKFADIYSLGNKRLLKNYLNLERPNIVHVQNYGNLSPSILGALLHYKKNNQVVIIQTLHTFEISCSHFAGYDYRKKTRCLDCNGKKYKTKIFYRFCSRLGVLHSIGKGIASIISSYYRSKVFDYYITPSFFLKQTVEEYSPTIPVECLNNPLPDVFIQNSIDVNNKKNNVVYFGRLSEEKNVTFLLQAFSLCLQVNKELVLYIIGDGPELSKLQDLTSLLKMDKSVTFVPFVNQAVLRSFLAKAKVSVLPSKCFETASMLVFESVSSKVVPIVGDYGGMKEMVNLVGVGKTFKEGDTKDLSLKILSELGNFTNSINLFEDAYDKIMQMNLVNYATKLSNIYTKLKIRNSS